MTPHYRYRCCVTGRTYIIAWDEYPRNTGDVYLGKL